MFGSRMASARGLVLLAVVLVAGACGGGDSDDTAVTTTSTSAALAATTLTTTSSSSSSSSTLTTYGTISTTTTLSASERAIGSNDVPQTTDMEASFSQERINGVSYTNALIMTLKSYTTQTAEVQIDAGRSNKRFLGDLGVPDQERSSTAFKVDIVLDNSAPVLSTELRFGETKRIDLDVTNVLRVKITVTALSPPHDYQRQRLAIGTPRFSR